MIIIVIALFVGFGLSILPAFRHDRALRELEAMPRNYAPADKLQHFTDTPEGES